MRSARSDCNDSIAIKKMRSQKALGLKFSPWLPLRHPIENYAAW
jgi:hypothetical protein